MQPISQQADFLMKQKEADFIKTLLDKTKGQSNVANMAFDFSDDKQLMYYLDKWTGKNWWEYGVSLRTGWFTPQGIKHFTESSEKPI